MTSRRADLAAPIVAGVAALVLNACMPDHPAPGRPGRFRAISSGIERVDTSFGDVAGVVVATADISYIGDATSQAVYAVDWRTGRTRQVTSNGAGPGEVRAVSQIARGRWGHAYVADAVQRRIVEVAAGEPARAVASVANVPFGATFAGGDSLGFLYFEKRPIVQGQSASTPADSALVLRLWPAGRLDTVAHVLAPRMASRAIELKSARGLQRSTVLLEEPLSPQDRWVVSDDGSVVIARSRPFRLAFVRRAGVSVGPELPFEEVRVTDLDRRRASVPASVAPYVDWPKSKPPFVGPLIACTDGSYWLEESVAATDSMRIYFRLGSSGELLERLGVPREQSVTACGFGFVYVLEADPDGIHRLARYPIHDAISRHH